MKKSAIWIIFLSIICCLFFSGCDSPFEYHGPYVAFNTIASNNLIGLRSVDESKIAVMEEDDYGRTLFAYRGGSVLASGKTYDEKKIYGVLVCQKSDKKYVYYYPDYSFLVRTYQFQEGTYSMTEAEMVEDVYNLYSDEEIRALKEINDWGKPLNESKCIRVKISRVSRGKIEKFISEDMKQVIYSQMGYSEGNTGLFYYLTSDDYERHVYFSIGPNEEHFFVMIHNDALLDETTGIAKVKDVWGYQDELKEFKERNNWNRPLN